MLVLISKCGAEHNVSILSPTSAFLMHVDIFNSLEFSLRLFPQIKNLGNSPYDVRDKPPKKLTNTQNCFLQHFLNTLRRLVFPDFLTSGDRTQSTFPEIMKTTIVLLSMIFPDLISLVVIPCLPSDPLLPSNVFNYGFSFFCVPVRRPENRLFQPMFQKSSRLPD